MNLLAGDIGGTKSLLGIYNFNGQLNLIHKNYYHSKEWVSLESIIENFLSNLPPQIEYPKVGCIGIAGPITNGRINLTNLNWTTNLSSIKKIARCKEIILLNDFSCLVYSIPFLKENQYAYIQQKNTPLDLKNDGIFAIIGAGTGLGVSRGVITKRGLNVLPSEGGHKEFSARNDIEWELSKWLKKDLNLSRLSIERIVSGTGLGNIARWRLSKEDAKNHPIRRRFNMNELKNDVSFIQGFPEQIHKKAKEGDVFMKEVLQIWLSAYGSVAGDIVLNELCNSGLWIAGGTAKKHLEGLRSESFLESLKNKGRFSYLLENLPIMALIDPDAGLYGAACKAHLITKNERINLTSNSQIN